MLHHLVVEIDLGMSAKKVLQVRSFFLVLYYINQKSHKIQETIGGRKDELIDHSPCALEIDVDDVLENSDEISC
jgi:hypothetical protein